MGLNSIALIIIYPGLASISLLCNGMYFLTHRFLVLDLRGLEDGFSTAKSLLLQTICWVKPPL